MLPFKTYMSIEYWLKSVRMYDHACAPHDDVCCICCVEFNKIATEHGYMTPPPIIQLSACKHVLHYICMKRYLCEKHLEKRRALQVNISDENLNAQLLKIEEEDGNDILSTSVQKELLSFSAHQSTTSTSFAPRQHYIEIVCPLCKNSTNIWVYDGEYIEPSAVAEISNPQIEKRDESSNSQLAKQDDLFAESSSTTEQSCAKQDDSPNMIESPPLVETLAHTANVNISPLTNSNELIGIADELERIVLRIRSLSTKHQ